MPSYSNHSQGSNASPSSSSQGNNEDNSEDNSQDNSEGKRNRRTRALSALLSATALGVFLEGCCASVGGNSGGAVPPPTAVVVTSTAAQLATANAEAFTGDEEENTVSYANADGGVIVDLQTPADNEGNFAQRDSYSSIENIVGSSHVDSLTGDNEDNTLAGGADNDDLEGGLGADTLIGGAGDDVAIYEDAGEGVRVDLSLTGAQQDFAANSFGFTANNNEAVGDILSDIEAVEGSAHADWLTGDDDVNSLLGGGGDDRLEGGAGADTLDGGAGNDDLDGGLGADMLIGGVGDDVAFYGDAGEGVRVDLSRADAQQDFVANSFGFTANGNEAVGDQLIEMEDVKGSVYADWLTGDDDVNSLRGGAGDDRLEGGLGADSYMFGAGDGTDMVVDDGGTIVFLQGASKDYTGATYIFTRTDGGSSLSVTLTVSKDGNVLNVLEFTSDPSLGFTFYTRDSNGLDSIIPASSLVVPPRLGCEVNPFLATLGVDIFSGSLGCDWVSYENSAAGVRITLTDSFTPATVSEGWAVGDMLTNINSLFGSDHRDVLRGNSGANIFRGGGGVDSLFGGAGADFLYGGDDVDRLEGGAGADTLDGGGGRNYVTYIASDKGVRIDLSLTGAQQDFEVNNFGFLANANEGVGDIFILIQNIRGSSSDDWFTGDDGNNEFYSRAGNDRISGGAGFDYLDGGTGADFLDGGEDTDTAGYLSATRGVRVSLLLQGQQQDFEVAHGFATNNNDAVGDTLSNIENIRGSNHEDWLTGDDESNSLIGDDGADRLEGGDGHDNYIFSAGHGADTIYEQEGDTMTLRFEGSYYTSADFLESSNNFNRVGNNLEITIDKNPDDAITDKITILDAYDTDITTGTGDSAFTINIEFGVGAILPAVTTGDFWHTLSI